MNIEYKKLINCLSYFSENWILDKSMNLESIKDLVKVGKLDYNSIKEEYINAMKDETLDWVLLSAECELLLEPDLYTNVEMKNYVKFLLHDYLYPEKELKKEKLIALYFDIVSFLEKDAGEESFIFSYDLYNELVKLEKYKDLEYHNFWKIPCFIILEDNNGEKDNMSRHYFNGGLVANSEVKIERKEIENKYCEIGYYRHNDKRGYW